MKVLVVDDAQMIRERVIMLLKRYPGIEVVGESDDIAEALAIVYDAKPDVLVLDIMMPAGNGFQLLQYVKEHHLVPTVMILSNFADNASRRQASLYGADYFFDKSNEFDKVPTTIRALMQTLRIHPAEMAGAASLSNESNPTGGVRP